MKDLDVFRYEDIEVEQIIVNNIEYFNARKVAKCMGYKDEGAAVRNFVQRYYDEIVNDIIVMRNNLLLSLRQIGRTLSGIDLSNTYISYKGIEKWGMVARTEKGKEFREALANHLENIRKGKTLVIDKEKLEGLDISAIELIQRIHEENALIIQEIIKQNKEIKKVKQIAEKALSRTELITKKQFWEIYNKIKELKEVYKDKYIWRDVERLFKVSNIGQICIEDYPSVIAFLKERKENHLKKQRKLKY